jgi:hypothetical protein
MGMPVRMMVLNSSMESLMPPSTATPEPRCFFSLGPDPKEDDQSDSNTLAKATCLRLRDEVTEGVVEDRAAEVYQGGVD